MKFKKCLSILLMTGLVFAFAGVAVAASEGRVVEREKEEAKQVSMLQLQQMCKQLGGIWVGQEVPSDVMAKLRELDGNGKGVLPGVSSARNTCVILPKDLTVCPN